MRVEKDFKLKHILMVLKYDTSRNFIYSIGTETMDFNDFVECVVFNWLVVNFALDLKVDILSKRD